MNYYSSSYSQKLGFQSKESKMTLGEIRTLVRQGEHARLEFKLKANHPDKIIREIVAFANTNGGQLLVGVSDDGLIQGLKFPDDDEFVLIREIEKYISPKLDYEIERINVDGEKQILLFNIPQSFNKPHFVHSEVAKKEIAYVRIADRSVQSSIFLRN